MITITYTDEEGNPQEQTILTPINGMTWKGSKDTGPRSLDFSFLYVPLNKDFPPYKAATGDKVVWTEDKKVLFHGYIEKLDYDTDTGEVQLHCVDLMNNLMKSKFIGRKKDTLNKIAGEICGAFKLQNGINVDNSHIHNITSNGEKTYFDVLNTACKTMYKNYCLYMDGITLKLELKHNSQGLFKIGENIRASQFSQDISEIITKVLIIDNKGKVLQPVEDKALREKYGLFQTTYNYNKDCKNNYDEAKKLLKGVKNKAIIIADNNNACISGKYIEIFESINNYIGLFEIQTDTHIISDDSYMELEIELIKKATKEEIQSVQI